MGVIMESRDFNDAIASMPIIVALRGIQENEVNDVGKVLIDNGITVLEVPIRTKNAALSSLDANAIRSLNKVIEIYGEKAFVAAGTVMRVEDLSILIKAGIKVCLSPILNTDIVSEASNLGLSFIPGVETVSEAMSAITSGAKGLKLFPSVYCEPNGNVTVRHSPGYVRYLSKFVSCPIFPSGDAFLNDLPASYLAAGAAGINVGAQLYEPHIDIKELAARAKSFVAAMKRMRLP
jgi:2-dehydro-3-deoxyphosphogalactonate aldolase